MDSDSSYVFALVELTTPLFCTTMDSLLHHMRGEPLFELKEARRLRGCFITSIVNGYGEEGH
jgi:hypothetical protein